MNGSNHQQLQHIKWRLNNKFPYTVPIADDGLSLRSQTNTPKVKSTHMWDPQSTLIPLPFLCFSLEIRIIKMQRDSKRRQKVLFHPDNGPLSYIFFFLIIARNETFDSWDKRMRMEFIMICIGSKNVNTLYSQFLGRVDINYLFVNRTPPSALFELVILEIKLTARQLLVMQALFSNLIEGR